MSGLTQIWGIGAKRRELPDGSVLLEFERVASTMDTARDQVGAGKTEIIGVRAEYQSAGRGRSGSPWLAPPGACLLVTYILWPNPDSLEPNRLSFAVAVALAEAIELVTESAVVTQIKWPNDIMANGLKLAGVLVEAIPHPSETGKTIALVGMGVNANVDQFPRELQSIATSLEIETGMLVDLDELEEAVRMQLQKTLTLSFAEVLASWRKRDDTAGRKYLAVAAEGDVIGTAIGISDTGALILQTASGVKEVISATSIHNEGE